MKSRTSASSSSGAWPSYSIGTITSLICMSCRSKPTGASASSSLGSSSAAGAIGLPGSSSAPPTGSHSSTRNRTPGWVSPDSASSSNQNAPSSSLGSESPSTVRTCARSTVDPSSSARVRRASTSRGVHSGSTRKCTRSRASRWASRGRSRPSRSIHSLPSVTGTRTPWLASTSVMVIPVASAGSPPVSVASYCSDPPASGTSQAVLLVTPQATAKPSTHRRASITSGDDNAARGWPV